MSEADIAWRDMPLDSPFAIRARTRNNQSPEEARRSLITAFEHSSSVEGALSVAWGYIEGWGSEAKTVQDFKNAAYGQEGLTGIEGCRRLATMFRQLSPSKALLVASRYLPVPEGYAEAPPKPAKAVRAANAPGRATAPAVAGPSVPRAAVKPSTAASSREPSPQRMAADVALARRLQEQEDREAAFESEQLAQRLGQDAPQEPAPEAAAAVGAAVGAAAQQQPAARASRPAARQAAAASAPPARQADPGTRRAPARPAAAPRAQQPSPTRRAAEAALRRSQGRQGLEAAAPQPTPGVTEAADVAHEEARLRAEQEAASEALARKLTEQDVQAAVDDEDEQLARQLAEQQYGEEESLRLARDMAAEDERESEAAARRLQAAINAMDAVDAVGESDAIGGMAAIGPSQHDEIGASRAAAARPATKRRKGPDEEVGMLSFSPEFFKKLDPPDLSGTPYFTEDGREIERARYVSERDGGDINAFLTEERHKVRREAICQQYIEGIEMMRDFLARHDSSLLEKVKTGFDQLAWRINDLRQKGTSSYIADHGEAERVLGSAKEAFDSILLLLESDKISLDAKKMELVEMSLGVEKCLQGTGVNIEDTLQRMYQAMGGIQNSAGQLWESWFRDNAQALCVKYLSKTDLYVEKEIHHIVKLRRMVGTPYFGLPERPDSYNFSEVTQALADELHQKLKPIMTESNVYETLTQECWQLIQAKFDHFIKKQQSGTPLDYDDVAAMRKIYDEQLKDTLAFRVSGIDEFTLWNEYRGPKHDGETYAVIEDPTMIKRQIVKNHRADGGLADEGFQILHETTALAAGEEPPANDDEPAITARQALKAVDWDCYYIRQWTRGAKPHWPLRVDDLSRLPAAVRRPGMVYAAVQNTSDPTLLSQLSPQDVWNDVLFAAGKKNVSWESVFTAGIFKRYRAANADNANHLIRLAIHHLLSAEGDTQNNLRKSLQSVINCGDEELAIRILENIEVPVDYDKDANNFTHLAAKQGMCGLLAQLAPVCHVDEKNYAGETAFFIAAANGHADAMRLLTGLGADRSIDDAKGRSPFAIAAANGHKDPLIYLLRELNVRVQQDRSDALGNTPLMHAVKNGHAAVVELLLNSDSGLDIKRRNRAGDDALILAARHAPSIVPMLLALGVSAAELNPQTLKGPLHAAAEAGQVSAVEPLIEAGAPVEPSLRRGQDRRSFPDSRPSPLRLAAANGKGDVVEALLARGASIESIDRLGNSALMLAATNGHANVITRLAKAGADLNRTNTLGTSPLHAALNNKHLEAATALLEAEVESRVSPNDRLEHNGMTALMAAVLYCPVAVEMLLKRKAKIGDQDHAGRNAFHHAAKKGDLDALKVLLAHRDASRYINVTDRYGRTPLDMVGANKREAREALEAAGARKSPRRSGSTSYPNATLPFATTSSNPIVTVPQATGTSLYGTRTSLYGDGTFYGSTSYYSTRPLYPSWLSTPQVQPPSYLHASAPLPSAAYPSASSYRNEEPQPYRRPRGTLMPTLSRSSHYDEPAPYRPYDGPGRLPEWDR